MRARDEKTEAQEALDTASLSADPGQRLVPLKALYPRLQ